MIRPITQAKLYFVRKRVIKQLREWNTIKKSCSLLSDRAMKAREELNKSIDELRGLDSTCALKRV